MDKELLLKYKAQNPEKFAQKFGHIDLENLSDEATTEEVVVEEKKEAEVEASEEDKTDSE